MVEDMKRQTKNEKQMFILTLRLKTELWQEHVLDKRFEIARKLYNACVTEFRKRIRVMKQSKEYRKLVNDLKRTYQEEEKIKLKNEKIREYNKNKSKKDRIKELKFDDTERKQINNQLNELRLKYGLSGSFDINRYLTNMRKPFQKHLDSATTQNLSPRLWRSIEKYLFSNGNSIRYKKYNELCSLESKTNESGIKFRDNQIIWNGLIIPVIIKKNDTYAQMALQNKIKYCRILKQPSKRKMKYYVQLVLEGIPPQKYDKNTGEFKRKIGNGTVGIDIGTKTIAYTSDKEARLLELAPEVDAIEKEKVRLQQKLERQRRVNNPHKYNPDGTIKKGNKEAWIWSKNALKTKQKYAYLCRLQRIKRKESHEKLANQIILQGNKIKVENMSFQGLQKRAKETTINEKTGKYNKKKRFGRSIGLKAPAMLLEILNRKLKYHNEELIKINTQKVKASQYNHFTDEYIKKSLNERWNNFDGTLIQRDLYSSFIIKNVENDKVDRGKCFETWENFKRLHDIEIERLRKMKEGGHRILSSIGI
jgi:hypothetical protein